MTNIPQQLEHVLQRIAAACAAAGRDTASVRLLAVSKTVSPANVQQALLAGQLAFGENYVQEGVAKIQALAQLVGVPQPEWHCIGPLQSNKTALVAQHFDWVQSVDRLKIAQRLSEQRPAHLPPLQVCLQVNIDGGTNKSGVAPDAALQLAVQVAALPRLQLRGLMSIPEPAIDFTSAKALHTRVSRLFSQINASGLLPAEMDTLSLGMSADLEAAIHAGSTLVRVGTAIFGERVAEPVPSNG